jgi:hypothetical protein
MVEAPEEYIVCCPTPVDVVEVYIPSRLGLEKSSIT